MTKEELEKEAYRWTEKNISVGISMYNPNIVMYCRKAYKDSAEPREKQIQTLGERCNQLLKDKGNLTDELQELKETLAHTIENDEVAYETLKLHDQEEIGMLNSKITKLEQQMEKMKCCALCNNYNMNYLPYWCRTNCVPTKPYEKCKYWEIKEND